jgi:hypothetical protein
MSAAPRKTPAALYRLHFRDTRRERLFLSSLSFFVTFFVIRGITHAIHAGVGPFHNLAIAGTHLHHLVWGILLVLAVGYVWLLQIGTGIGAVSRRASNVTALLYGIGAALTMDEFALWLRLEDVYWDSEGRLSIDAVILFGALLSIGIWGGPFLRALLREAAHVLRR